MQKTKSFIVAIFSVLVICCIIIFAASLAAVGIRAGAEENVGDADPKWEHEREVHDDAEPLNKEAIPSDNVLQEGRYYLNNNILLEEPITVSGNVSLCLNGCTITAPQEKRAFVVGQGATLLLCDCSEGQGIVTGAYAEAETEGDVLSGGVLVQSGGRFVLRSGSIAGSVIKATANDEYGTVSVQEGGEFSMYGGSIADNTAILGGGVYAHGGTVSVCGGSIEGNTATGDGGGIYVWGGSVTVCGGSISNNTAANTYAGMPGVELGRGGGVFILNAATFSMSGGSIEGNTAAKYGGGIYSEGAFDITGGSLRSNVSQDNGGGIYVNSGTAKISGNFVLYGNTAPDDKIGGLYVSLDSSDIVKGGIILAGGFFLDPVGGNTEALAVQGGYYPEDAVNVEDSTVCGKYVTSKYHLIPTDEKMEEDPDYAALAAEEKGLLAYAVYAVGETVFSLTPAEGGIVYDGRAVEAGIDFTVQALRNGEPDEMQPALGEYYKVAYVSGTGEEETPEKGESCGGAPSGAGEYILDVSAEERIDYANKTYYGATQGTVLFTVSKAVLTDNTQDVEVEYSGEPVGLQFELSGFVGDENFTAAGGKTEYSSQGGEDADDWSETPVAVTNVADSKNVWYRFTFANYDVKYGDGLCGKAAIVVTPAAPAASVLCGSALGSAEGLAAGWKWSNDSTEITANANTAQAYYPLAGEDGTVGYGGWQTVAEKKGWSYNDAEKRLECEVKLTVTHSAELLDHHDAVASTCETAGNIEYWQCQKCEGYFSDKDGQTPAESVALPLAQHTLATHHDAVAATCTKDGSLEYYSCSVCGKNFADEKGTKELDSTVAPKLGHSLVHHPAAEATEEADGNTEYWECSRCHEYFADSAAAKAISDKESVVLPQITHTAEIVGLILGGAIIIVLVIELILLCTKKRREEE